MTEEDAELPELSIVVPVHDERENVRPLLQEIAAALEEHVRFEVIVVDDASSDGTAAELASIDAPELRVLRHRWRAGQSAAIVSGVRAARGPLVATLDGDRQNDPADIVHLLDVMRTRGGADVLVAGRRTGRQDSWNRRAQSQVANTVRRMLLRDRTQDTGCSLKLFPRQLFLELPSFDHMHRFLPALVLAAGGRVESVDVSHRPRVWGRTKYGLFDRLWIGIVDLWGVRWLQRRVLRPEIESDPYRR